MTLTALRPVDLDDDFDAARPAVDEQAVRAVTAATLAELPPLTLPGPTCDIPTDPACAGRRHGSYAAYKKHRCRCPEVRAYVYAKRAQQLVVREALLAAGLIVKPAPPPPGRPVFDEGDVEAAVWAAVRWRPLPAGLTRAERIAVAHRLRGMGSGWSGLMAASEIGQRMGYTERTAERYLDTTVVEAIAAAGDVGDHAADWADEDVDELVAA